MRWVYRCYSMSRRPRTSGFTSSFRPRTSRLSSGPNHDFVARATMRPLRRHGSTTRSKATHLNQAGAVDARIHIGGTAISKTGKTGHNTDHNTDHNTGNNTDKNDKHDDDSKQQWKRNSGSSPERSSRGVKFSVSKAIQSGFAASIGPLSEEGGMCPGTSVEDFDVRKLLGKGAHGVVHLAKSNIDGKLYVLKEINVTNLKEHRKKRVVSEVLLLRRLRHPNIIQYYTSFVDNGSLYIVMEYANIQRSIVNK